MYQNRSRKPLVLLGIIIFLLVGGVGIYLLMSFNNAASQASSQAGPTAAPKVTTTKIVIAAHDIQRGARLTEQDVMTMDWPNMPEAPIPTNAIIVGETADQPGLDQVNDHVAKVDIPENQPVLQNMITPIDKPGQLGAKGSDAALLIPAGKIAITIPINRISSVAYLLREGDHVDVLMSFRFIDIDKDFQTKLPNGVTTFDGGTGFTQSPNASSTLGIDTQGREENGAFGLRIMVVPSELDQRPRQATQIMISNAVVLHIGQASLTDSIIVTPETATSSEGTATPEPAQSSAQATEAPMPVPDIITLVVSRQDALVLKYSLEVGADIDLGLRSAYDNAAQDDKTDSVTLQYLFDFYNLAEPPKLPIGFDPSIDTIVNPQGSFQQNIPSAAPAQETPAP